VNLSAPSKKARSVKIGETKVSAVHQFDESPENNSWDYRFDGYGEHLCGGYFEFDRYQLERA
jgi:hypothetical protein